MPPTSNDARRLPGADWSGVTRGLGPCDYPRPADLPAYVSAPPRALLLVPTGESAGTEVALPPPHPKPRESQGTAEQYKDP